MTDRIKYEHANELLESNDEAQQAIKEIINRAYTNIGAQLFTAAHVRKWFIAEGLESPNPYQIGSCLRRLGFKSELKRANAAYYRLRHLPD